MDAATFSATLGPLFEDAPGFLGRLADRRPFGSWDRLFRVAEAVATEMPEVDRLELVDAHPRIGAPPASVSALSFVEQGYDRDAGPTMAAATMGAEAKRDGVGEALARLNAEYEGRFGFRFVVFVAGRPRSAIIPLIEVALGGDRTAELRRALIDVMAIARDRASQLGTPLDVSR